MAVITNQRRTCTALFSIPYLGARQQQKSSTLVDASNVAVRPIMLENKEYAGVND
jgi:hypothetical protein